MVGALRQAYHVQWHIAQDNPRYTMETTDHYTSLTITNIKSDDYRTYVCIVSVVNPIDRQQWVCSRSVYLYDECCADSNPEKEDRVWNKISSLLISCILVLQSVWKIIISFLVTYILVLFLRSLYKDSDIDIKNASKIGNGAFGTVFRTTFKGSPCAAKLLTHHAQELISGLNATANIQPEALKSFRKECDFLESLRHKNIVRHLATVTEPNSNLPILVLELMDCSLKQYLEKRVYVKLSHRYQISICSDISRGLKYLHSQEIIHRDLCDDNILLALNSDIPTAKIADFGMSRIIPHDHLSATLTALGHRQVYLPPEAADDPHYNYTLDIYSFGVIVTQIVKVKTHLKSKEELFSLFEEISDTHPLKTIICCCLADDKTKRPQTADLCDKIHTLT